MPAPPPPTRPPARHSPPAPRLHEGQPVPPATVSNRQGLRSDHRDGPRPRGVHQALGPRHGFLHRRIARLWTPTRCTDVQPRDQRDCGPQTRGTRDANAWAHRCDRPPPPPPRPNDAVGEQVPIRWVPSLLDAKGNEHADDHAPHGHLQHPNDVRRRRRGTEWEDSGLELMEEAEGLRVASDVDSGGGGGGALMPRPEVRQRVAMRACYTVRTAMDYSARVSVKPDWGIGWGLGAVTPGLCKRWTYFSRIVKEGGSRQAPAVHSRGALRNSGRQTGNWHRFHLQLRCHTLLRSKGRCSIIFGVFRVFEARGVTGLQFT